MNEQERLINLLKQCLTFGYAAGESVARLPRNEQAQAREDVLKEFNKRFIPSKMINITTGNDNEEI